MRAGESILVHAGAGGGIEALIVGLTWVFAVSVLRWSWTNRDELLLTR